MPAVKGIKFTLKHRRKLSKALKGIVRSDTTKLKISLSNKGVSRNKGKKHSEETKRKIRKSSLKQFKNGMPQSTKDKISRATKGRKDSDETKKRKRLAVRKRIKEENICLFKKENKLRLGSTAWNKGKKCPENDYWKDKHHSEETKKKITKTLQGKYIGKNASNWRGGKSFEDYGIEFNNHLKRKIRKRDNYKCRKCNKT